MLEPLTTNTFHLVEALLAIKHVIAGTAIRPHKLINLQESYRIWRPLLTTITCILTTRQILLVHIFIITIIITNIIGPLTHTVFLVCVGVMYESVLRYVGEFHVHDA